MSGVLSIVGVGPGDPDLLTLKGVNRLQRADVIYIPTSRLTRQNWLAEAVAVHADKRCHLRKVEFSLGSTRESRQHHWQDVAGEMIHKLQQGTRIVFVTLGDPLLYSTSIYLLRALRQQWPTVPVDIVPGITAYSHVAALTEFAVGEGEQPVTILPTVMDRAALRQGIKAGGTLVLMKIGQRLPQIIDLLDEFSLLEYAVFVARAGFPDQRIETNLNNLRGADAKAGNLAVILVDASAVMKSK